MPRPPDLSEAGPELETLDVIVGIVCDPAARILIAERPGGKHMAGLWEFPGGKLEPGEPPAEGLRRELLEELGILVDRAEPFLEHVHHYPERTVRLDIWWVRAYDGTAEPREGQRLRWVTIDELERAPLLPADAPIVTAIRHRLSG